MCRPVSSVSGFTGFAMATFKAHYSVDSLLPDLNFYARHFWDDAFYDNIHVSYRGEVYPDVYDVNGFDGTFDLLLSLGGTGLGFDAWGDLTRGTVTAIVESFFDGTELWSLQGTAVSAVSMHRAALTASDADDRAVFARMMAGHDVIDLSSQSDRFEGWAGNDRMFGHGGHDTLMGGTGHDTLTGGAGNDRLLGETGNDRLIGGTGNDRLLGAAGLDVLEGGSGADILEGGSGRDRMFAGLDASRDVFVFRARSDTAVGTQRDTVHQFRRGHDDIDLSAMDAHAGRGGNQAFAFSGTTAAAHSVWYVRHGDGVILRGDVTGNRTADFEIWVDDVARLAAGDLIL